MTKKYMWLLPPAIVFLAIVSTAIWVARDFGLYFWQPVYFCNGISLIAVVVVAATWMTARLKKGI